jgi:hypothetical protein
MSQPTLPLLDVIVFSVYSPQTSSMLHVIVRSVEQNAVSSPADKIRHQPRPVVQISRPARTVRRLRGLDAASRPVVPLVPLVCRWMA